ALSFERGPASQELRHPGAGNPKPRVRLLGYPQRRHRLSDPVSLEDRPLEALRQGGVGEKRADRHDGVAGPPEELEEIVMAFIAVILGVMFFAAMGLSMVNVVSDDLSGSSDDLQAQQ